MMRRTLLALASSAALWSCKADVPPPVLAPPEPGLEADPRWMTFTCVEPGCDKTLTATIRVIGGRDLAIKRVVLSDRDRTDITVTPGKPPPFILKATETFSVNVQYRPTGDPRLGDVNVLVTYTDASANESEMRVKAGELEIPVVRRLVGEPTIAVDPPVLDFGAVLPGARKTLPLTIKNTGFGNVGLVLESVRSDLLEVSTGPMPMNAILPGRDFSLDVTFAPQDEAFVGGYLTVRSADPSAPTPMVAVVGTSIPRATIAVTPERAIDFGEVPVLMMDKAHFSITNQGAEPLMLTSVDVQSVATNTTFMLRLPRSATSTAIPPLGSITGTITIAGVAAGLIEATLHVVSNDVLHPAVDIPIVGTITEPNIAVTPGMVDFGRVPRGWAVPRPIEVENTGYGDLTITYVGMVLGSSMLYTPPTAQVPIKLRHGQRVAFEVEFRSEAEATFNGSLAFDSDDPDQPHIEVPLVAVGASCNDGCPIAHGTPTCTSGVCDIAMCDIGYYNTDLDASTGCECAEVGTDPGTFCAEGNYLGTMSDEGGRSNYTGIISTTDDVDMIRFFALDESQFFSDDFDVRVRLESGDPGIRFCMYRHPIDHHENACILDEESCPGDRNYRKDGSLGPDDSADFTIKVFRSPQSAPSCTTYTIFVSNG